MEVTTGSDSGLDAEWDVESNDSSMSSLSTANSTNNPSSSNGLPVPPNAQKNSPPANLENEKSDSTQSDNSNSQPQPSTSAMSVDLPTASSSTSNNFSVPNSLSKCSTSSNSTFSSTLATGLASINPESLASCAANAASSLMSSTPPPSVTDDNGDGYLGDCSSDGGDGGSSDSALSNFYHYGHSHGVHHRKMRSSVFRGRYSHNNWSPFKRALANRQLMLAAIVNNVDLVQRLLSRKSVNPNEMDEQKRTALHFSASKGYTEIVRLLLSHGADPNQKDIQGNTALHLAACTNHVGVVTLLLRGGTNVTQLDNHGRTPMQLAQSKLRLLQKSSSDTIGMEKVKTEVAQVLEMMKEYFLKKGQGTNKEYTDILSSFSERFTLHQTHDDINSDLKNLLDSLDKLQV